MIPVTTPETGSIVAILVAVLLHVPPPVASDSEDVPPGQTTIEPEIALTDEFTVTGATT
jgi:hypothetical protein